MSTSPGPSNVTLTSTSPRTYPQLILFGDSITQFSGQGLLARLSDYYVRRLDVINRGFSGYTAPMGLDVLRKFFLLEPPSQTEPRVRLMSVFFGANDACVPGVPQHVPLEKYVESLRSILGYPGIELHGTKIILITPAPIDEWQLNDTNRNAENTLRYAAACRELGEEVDLPIVDLWTVFMKKAGWKPGQEGHLPGSRKISQNSILGDLLIDGLHFSPLAYQILYDELVKVIEEKLPTEAADKLPIVYPDWKEELGV